MTIYGIRVPVILPEAYFLIAITLEISIVLISFSLQDYTLLALLIRELLYKFVQFSFMKN